MESLNVGERLWDSSWYMKLTTILLSKRTKKIAALGVSGKVDLKAKLCWMKKP
ncbi:hypothetical protein [Vibrio neptunius]|uniref:hypothetical protein n=1 Tax=Vibrio neptunius TaxID=170651 RepID=UPI003CE49BB6